MLTQSRYVSFPTGQEGRDQIVKVLECSRMYQSAVVINTCLNQLQNRKWQVPAAELIHYATNYPSDGSISKPMFEGAFHQLASGSLQDITPNHEFFMGSIVFSVLARLLAAINAHCHIVATEPIPVEHEPDCNNHRACYDDWYLAWWNGVGQFLLDGHNPLPFQEAIKRFENWDCGQMSESCKVKTMSQVQSGDAWAPMVELTGETSKRVSDFNRAL